MKIKFLVTCADVFSKPHEVPSLSGYVTSAASSKPTGKYPVMKKPNKKLVPNTIHIFMFNVNVNNIIAPHEHA